MAERTPDTGVSGKDVSRDGSARVWRYTGSNKLANNDTTAPIPFAEWADRSVQFVGTFDGGTVVWEGSNDGGVTYFTLNDLSGGNAISKTAAGGEGVAEVTELARARASGGGGSMSVEVHVICRRANPLRT